MLWFLFAGNIWIISLLYSGLAEKKANSHSVSMQMNVMVTPPILFALCSGFIFTYMHPGFFIETSIAAGTLGMGCGLLFGSLFGIHAAMAGASSALTAGMLAPMLGELAGRSPLFLVFAQLVFFIWLFFLRYNVRSFKFV
ncbi:hypothetical protein [Bacillus piscicola]|uniref:hypothetical protein n=1 Tax=Bacillus piscicola TaxID=1632684 RepID=UPI001F097372|nr:hypothetical protein [Bacillus piscicola]